MSDYFVHESAYVDEGAQIGDKTQIWHFSHVMPKVVIGENCRIGQNVVIANNVTIGNGVKIQNNVSVYEGVTLEDFVFAGRAWFSRTFSLLAASSLGRQARIMWRHSSSEAPASARTPPLSVEPPSTSAAL